MVEILLRSHILADFVVCRFVQILYVWMPGKNDISIDDLFGHTVVGHGALSIPLFAWLLPISVVEIVFEAHHLLLIDLFLHCLKIEIIQLLLLDFLFAIAVHILVRQS